MNLSAAKTHSASARISTGASDTAKTDVAAKSASDTALAIVTSRSTVAKALTAAKADRDPDTFSKSISVTPVGTSGVVDLRVTDKDPAVAVNVANRLSASLVELQQQIGGGSLQTLIANVNAEIAQSSRRVDDFQVAISAASAGPEGARSVLLTENANAQRQQHDLQVKHDALQQASVKGTGPVDVAAQLTGLNSQLKAGSEHIAQLESAIADADRSQAEQLSLLKLQLDSTLKQQTTLQADRQRLVETQAGRPVPVIVSGAKLAADDKSRLASTLVLAALLGFVLALAIASLLETLRPSVVGAEALARTFDTSVLATLSGSTDTVSAGEIGVLAGYLRLAANARGVDRVELVTVDPKVDLERFALRLGDHLVADPEVSVLHLAKRPGSALAPFDPRLCADAINGELTSATAMVLVGPAISQRRDLDPITHLLAITGWPLLGIVTYKPGRSKRATSDTDRPADRSVAIDVDMAERSVVPTG